MLSAASVPQESAAIPSFLPVILILLPVAGVVARGLISQSTGHSAGLFNRYRVRKADLFSSEFVVAIIFIGLWLYTVLGQRSFTAAVPLTGTLPGSELLSDITPLLVVLLPFAGALISGLIGRSNKDIRDCVATCTAFLTCVLAISMYPMVAAGEVSYALPEFMGLGLLFRVDFFGFVFAVMASFIWFLATFYSGEYMRHEHASTRYYVFLLLSLGGTLGVFLAGDFLSLFLFFEAMTLFSYVLVVHAQSEEAMAAGRNYLYMGIFGGLCLLVAIMMVTMHAGTTAIAPGLESLADMGTMGYVAAGLFFIGFGIKAGAAPLHIWLPQAHPVAPTPASALLSGIMIKTGAYGIIRVFTLLYTPTQGESPLWYTTEQFGYALIWFGMVTMFTAAVLALVQRHAKRVLAYSSVSQMGYILMGIGAAAYLGFDGAMGFAGWAYHILNHAFFKSAMFLMVGAIYLRTHSLDYSKVGGLWRRFPVTAAAFLVAGAAIAGVPGFNGYVSKTLLHHAIVDAWQAQGVTSLWYAEKIFTITGGLTVCYIARLFYSLFLGPARGDTHKYARETFLERTIFAGFAAFLLYGGLAYSNVIERVILPMSTGFVYNDYYLNYVAKTGVWNGEDLFAISISLGIGAVTFLLLSRIDFALPLPQKLSVERLIYKPVLNFSVNMFMAVGRGIEFVTEGVLVGSVRPSVFLARLAGSADAGLLPRVGEAVLLRLTQMRESVYTYVVSMVHEVQVYTREAEWVAFFTMIKLDYNHRGDHLYKKLTLMNLDLCLFIIIITLVIVFSLRFLTLMVP
ncbi:complex I subunit 5 family protein [Dethiobacter alkaliphilus]|uniref:complex I subunit 5 family protein n=1 Tax=Dethiobacter alkaliphilus TaxID=427926 RepID=UPI002227E6F2|nr:proton-conducting transporter membrane subunit [Dethiobacter alkaliphilus]MCW3489180.1 proton-conducting transporter membrane subunit [Dethiobacter alkaliphilus]